MDIKRQSKYEWLRVLAMGMIITLHYMFKGGIISSTAQDMSVTNIIMWIITAFSICAVNVYVLISGYFLAETEFKFSRIIALCVQVLEYSLIITGVMLATGQVSVNDFSFYDWIGYVLPIGSEEYWFITAYILMYLFAPLLAAGVKKIDKRSLELIIGALLVFVSIEKTIIPMYLATDKLGYDFGWFMTLFVIAAYIRIYGIAWLEGHKLRSMAVYLISVVIIILIGIIAGILYGKTGIESFAHYAEIVWDYNFIIVLSASIGLFYLFKNSEFKENCKIADIGRLLGGLTLGVYLLHEHPLIRYRWQALLGVSKDRGLIMILLNWLLCVLVIYVCGAFVEWIRSGIHKLLFKGKKQ